VSAFSLLSIGSRAMTANYVALQTTGNNIANANVEGYSRQRVELSTAASQSTGDGNIGRGVDVKAVTRAHDQFLTREAAGAQSTAQMDQARLSALKRLEEAFPTGERGVGHATTLFLNAMSDLAGQPAEQGLRKAVLARAVDDQDSATRLEEIFQAADAVRISRANENGGGAQIERLDRLGADAALQSADEVGHHRLGAGEDQVAVRLGLVQPLGRGSGDDGHGATGARFIGLRRFAHGGGGAARTVDMKRIGGRLGVGGQGRRAQKGGQGQGGRTHQEFSWGAAK
jgi:flagellar hook-associated protein 1 FlgK